MAASSACEACWFLRPAIRVIHDSVSRLSARRGKLGEEEWATSVNTRWELLSRLLPGHCAFGV